MRTRAHARWIPCAVVFVLVALMVPAGASVVEPPAAVENLAGAASPGHVTLTWDAPMSDGGAPVTSYRIWRDAVPWVEVPAGEQTFVDRSVDERTDYTYSVAAMNTAGQGPATTVTVTTLGRPQAPRELVAQPGAGIGEVAVSWVAPEFDGGTGVRGYRIYRDGVLITDVAADKTSFVDSGLLPTQAYRYTVMAANDVGLSGHSLPACSPPGPWPAAAAVAFCARD